MRERTRRTLSGFSFSNGAFVLLLFFVSLTPVAGQNYDPEYQEILKRFPTRLLRGIHFGSAPHVVSRILRGCELQHQNPKSRELLLRSAISQGDLNCVKLLVESGVPISGEVRGWKGSSPIVIAATSNQADISRYLLRVGVSPNSEDAETALYVASALGHLQVAEALLDGRVNPNSASVDGYTPLMIAAGASKIEALSLLLRRGANTNTRTVRGETALMLSSDCTETVQLLISYKSDLEKADAEGKTALHYAVSNAQPAKLRLLLEAGIKRDTKTKDGRSATDLAATIEDKEKRREILAILEAGK